MQLAAIGSESGSERPLRTARPTAVLAVAVERCGSGGVCVAVCGVAGGVRRLSAEEASRVRAAGAVGVVRGQGLCPRACVRVREVG